MNNTISEYIQIFDKRIFFDVASDGCGSGCIYCFSKHPANPQRLLTEKKVVEICDKILCLPECGKSILSLCPNTEPMKSEESRKVVKRIIDKLVNSVKFIQISTKEMIPLEFLQYLNSVAKFPGQIRISISLPYLRDVELIEPGAEMIKRRIKNFDNISKFSNLVSILYLRPFNRQMIQNKKTYVELINKYKPDDICLGVEFVPKVNGEQFCTYVYDKKHADNIFENVEREEIFHFAEYLRSNTKRKIFYSSTCNVANVSDYGCRLNLKKYDERYCQDCKL